MQWVHFCIFSDKVQWNVIRTLIVMFQGFRAAGVLQKAHHMTEKWLLWCDCWDVHFLTLQAKSCFSSCNSVSKQNMSPHCIHKHSVHLKQLASGKCFCLLMITFCRLSVFSVHVVAYTDYAKFRKGYILPTLHCPTVSSFGAVEPSAMAIWGFWYLGRIINQQADMCLFMAQVGS